METQTSPDSSKSIWAGRILSGLAVLFLVFDGVIKLIPIGPVIDSFNQLGYPVSLALAIGILELGCVLLYVIPRTSILGAILLTGYLGGAVATHVRVGSPLFSHSLFPIYIGLLIWGGLYLRDRRLHTLIPFRSEALRVSMVVIMSLVAFSNGTAAGQEINQPDEGTKMSKASTGNFASVNGLRMYYEIHGSGRPLVLLHGAFGWATVYPSLAKNRQTLAIEQQGHGHTGDIDRPLTYEQMADDTTALLKHLKIEQADFFGYSMGGNVALAVAIRHPNLVGKVAILGANSGKLEHAYEPEIFNQFKSIPANFAPKELKDPYDKVAPDPKQWPVLVAKIKRMDLEFNGFADKDMQAIKAPVLIMIGDRDAVRPEHAVEMYRLLPNAQLAVIPGADHFVLWTNPERVLASIADFLNAPNTK